MKRNGDPNGIRTRVTAVKGRCPGPLDDRVTQSRAISELLLLHARQIAELFQVFRSRWRMAPWLYNGIEFVNQRRCARGCALMLAQNFPRPLDEPFARFAIAQKLGDRQFERIHIGNLDRAFLQYQRLRQCREILHVRTKHDWFARDNRLHGILPAVRGQAFPHEHNRGDSIPAMKITCCIENNAIRV